MFKLSFNTWEAQSRNMMNICTKYGFDIFIISGSYGGHRRHMTYNGRRHGYMYGISSEQVISLLFLVVMVDTDDTRRTTENATGTYMA